MAFDGLGLVLRSGFEAVKEEIDQKNDGGKVMAFDGLGPVWGTGF